MSERGRVLGVDYGSVRIGLAVSDVERRIASPHATYERRGLDQDTFFFKEQIEQEEIKLIVVGLPVSVLYRLFSGMSDLPLSRRKGTYWRPA